LQALTFSAGFFSDSNLSTVLNEWRTDDSEAENSALDNEDIDAVTSKHAQHAYCCNDI